MHMLSSPTNVYMVKKRVKFVHTKELYVHFIFKRVINICKVVAYKKNKHPHSLPLKTRMDYPGSMFYCLGRIP